jgi:hypothetical protein
MSSRTQIHYTNCSERMLNRSESAFSSTLPNDKFNLIHLGHLNPEVLFGSTSSSDVVLSKSGMLSWVTGTQK